MNGVEAAASLFGSEESDSDLFATLGTDTTPSQFSSDLFLNDGKPDTQFYSQPETSTFGEYPAYTSPDHLSTGYNEPAQSYNDHWHYNEQAQKDIDDVAYSSKRSPSLNPPPAEVSTESYTPRPSLPQSNDNYLPPAIPATTNPVTTSHYSPYNIPSNLPPATSNVQEPVMQVPSTQPYVAQHASPAATQYLGASSLPITPNAKPTITRPKYSNAYDPPFIPSSSRRPGRTGGMQQAYNSYQQSSSPYIPAPHYTENSHVMSEMPKNQNYAAQSTYSNILDSPGTNYSGDTSLQSQRESYSYSSESLHNGLNAYPVKTQEDSYAFHKGDAQHNHHSSPSHNAINPSSSLNMSPPYQESEVSSFVNSTHSSIPASPSVSQYDTGTFAQTDNLNGYVSQHIPSYKREVTGGTKDVYDPYAPKANHAPANYIPRTSSPLSGLNRIQPEFKKPSNAPSHLSGQSSVSSIGASLSVHVPRSLNIADEYPRNASQRLDLKVGLQDIMKSSNAQYAPSPSLLGSNDPLARTSARAPVVAFGFGGKMVTCFHEMPGLNAGFDVALSSRTSSELKVHILHKLLPESALNSPSSSYPGPLLSDPGTPSMSLVRPSLSAQTKAKKTAVIGYLSSRVDEIDQGLGYLSKVEKRVAQGTLILVKLLKIMVENDGRLLGT